MSLKIPQGFCLKEVSRERQECYLIYFFLNGFLYYLPVRLFEILVYFFFGIGTQT